jgi:hypothetical protein
MPARAKNSARAAGLAQAAVEVATVVDRWRGGSGRLALHCARPHRGILALGCAVSTGATETVSRPHR